MDDTELLRAFVERRDAAAFRTIVERYTAVVYASARRQVGGGHLAEDVTQAVFILLARRADRLRAGAMLAGWLVRTARLAALAAVRAEGRLRSREKKVAAMTPATDGQDPTIPAEWREMTPLLDAALARLSEPERTAITLRYLQGKTVSEVGATMGITEWAASKRIARAVARLRDEFARRGTDLPVASVAAGISAHMMSAPPVNMSAQLAATALASDAGEGIAALIAQNVARILILKKIAAAVVAVVVILSIGSGGAWIVRNMRGSAPAHNNAGAPAARQGNAVFAQFQNIPTPIPAAQTGPIRVGVVLSEFTASTKYDGEKTFGYGNQSRIVGELHDRDLELLPVIEPGTEKIGPLSLVLHRDFANKTPINGYDANALRTLDVVVSAQVFLLRDEMVIALSDAVNDGVGLLFRQALGDNAPGYTPELLRLHGLVEAHFAQTTPWTRKVACEVIGTHPILGTLSGNIDATCNALPIGAFGTLAPETVPLIRVINLADLNPDEGARADWSFYPLYVTRLGRGAIIACQFDVHAPPPSELLDATQGQFTARCVKWLAAEHRAAATQPATSLAAPLTPASRPAEPPGTFLPNLATQP